MLFLSTVMWSCVLVYEPCGMIYKFVRNLPDDNWMCMSQVFCWYLCWKLYSYHWICYTVLMDYVKDGYLWISCMLSVLLLCFSNMVLIVENWIIINKLFLRRRLSEGMVEGTSMVVVMSSSFVAQTAESAAPRYLCYFMYMILVKYG